MTNRPMPKFCYMCKHYRANDETRCDAFPNGIPLPIRSGDVPHDKPIDGDNGVQFEYSDKYAGYKDFE